MSTVTSISGRSIIALGTNRLVLSIVQPAPTVPTGPTAPIGYDTWQDRNGTAITMRDGSLLYVRTA